MSSPSVNDYIYVGTISPYAINAYSPFSNSATTVLSLESGFSALKLLGFALNDTRLYFFQTGFSGSAPFKVSYLDADCNVVDVLDLPTGYGGINELDFNAVVAPDGTFMTAISHGGVTPPDEDIRSYDVAGTLINANLGILSAVFCIATGFTLDGDTAIAIGEVTSPTTELHGYSISASGGGLSTLFEIEPGTLGTIVSLAAGGPLVLPSGDAYFAYRLVSQVKLAHVSGGGLVGVASNNLTTDSVMGSDPNVADDGAYLVDVSERLWFADAAVPTSFTQLYTFSEQVIGRLAVGPRLSCVPITPGGEDEIYNVTLIGAN